MLHYADFNELSKHSKTLLNTNEKRMNASERHLNLFYIPLQPKLTI